MTLVVTKPPCIFTDTVTVVALVVVVTVVTVVGVAASGVNKTVPTGAMLGLPADGATSPIDIGVPGGRLVLPPDGMASLGGVARRSSLAATYSRASLVALSAMIRPFKTSTGRTRV